ncbi:hypothetical protein J8273_5907 [Carpediemonas membranifera]|uniref:Reverse transcriptase n=1 Tax=Carpediemonas membranifera TaxID=201153 RepID=A0A8J6BWT8_9EUKA|nr:hypothetical protein J8273_5907 [Carpediemonas membranifera]|eukprot:KAG9392766.1 hypothetical protein J8273_5907 [Carpediemonas membranifera]
METIKIASLNTEGHIGKGKDFTASMATAIRMKLSDTDAVCIQETWRTANTRVHNFIDFDYAMAGKETEEELAMDNERRKKYRYYMQSFGITIPYLRSLTRSAFFTFQDDVDHYQVQARALNLQLPPLATFLSPSVTRLVRLRVPIDDIPDGDLFDTIATEFFKFHTQVEAYQSIQRLRLRSLEPPALLAHIDTYHKTLALCDDNTRPIDQQTRKLFTASLPSALKTRLKIVSPETFAEACEAAITELDDIVSIRAQSESFRDEPRLDMPPRRPPPIKAKAEPTAPTVDRRPKSELICHGCGLTGHVRPECPHRDHPGFFAHGIRRQALNLTAKLAAHTNNSSPHVSLHFSDHVPRTALLDTGASLNFIPPALAEEMHLRLFEAHVPLETANGTITAEYTTRPVTITLQLERPVEVTAEFFVLPSAGELIIGVPTIRAVGLLPDLLAPRAEAEFVEATPVPLPDDRAPAEIAHPLIQDYPDLFASELPGVIGVEPFHIDTDVAPFPPRRMSPALAEAVKAEVDGLLARGIIQPSTSPFASPAFTVPKRGGKRRMVIDYRRLNEKTVPLQYPLSNPAELHRRLAGHNYYTTIDLVSGYHQVPVDPASRPLTAFATPAGLFEFCRLPFGLRCAPAFFQRMMMSVLNGLVGRICEVYLDDVIIHGDTQEELDRNTRAVFDRLQQHQFRLGRDKCQFAKTEVEYVGHLISKKGIRTSPERVAAIVAMKPPSSVAAVRSFTGMTNYLREFIPNYASVLAPIVDLTKAKVPFVWGKAQQQAFEEVKRLIMRRPILAYPDYSRTLIVRTDASTAGCGGVLLQEKDGEEQVIAYTSHRFTEAEQRWSTIEQELFGVFHAIISFEHFILGHPFVVETDHRNLTYLESTTTPKLVRWRLRLSELWWAQNNNNQCEVFK